mmetsp:Transcript_3005/g.10541  ORF Transcript_3005/g.10541 Transcript_3005/m.10541 type:complete len:318 (+) Transcript_3005:619-1572(+)
MRQTPPVTPRRELGARHSVAAAAAKPEKPPFRNRGRVARVLNVVELRGYPANFARTEVTRPRDRGAPFFNNVAPIRVQSVDFAHANALAQLLETSLGKVDGRSPVHVGVLRVLHHRPGLVRRRVHRVFRFHTRPDVLLRPFQQVTRHKRVLLPRQNRGVPLHDVHVDFGVQVVVGVQRVGDVQGRGDHVRKVEGELGGGGVQGRGEGGGVNHRETRVDQRDELLVVRVARANRVGDNRGVAVQSALGYHVVVFKRGEGSFVQTRDVRAFHLVDFEKRHRRELRQPGQNGRELRVCHALGGRLRGDVRRPRKGEVLVP